LGHHSGDVCADQLFAQPRATDQGGILCGELRNTALAKDGKLVPIQFYTKQLAPAPWAILFFYISARRHDGRNERGATLFAHPSSARVGLLDGYMTRPMIDAVSYEIVAGEELVLDTYPLVYQLSKAQHIQHRYLFIRLQKKWASCRILHPSRVMD
jgi:hypothetical protein